MRTWLSVLGACVYKGAANNTMDANHLSKSGWWYIVSENSPTNLPYIGNGMLVQLDSSSITLQLAFDKNTSKAYWRVFYAAWSEWIQF